MNRLVLIGNGFDLAHKLPTSYKDFINWYWDYRLHGLVSCKEEVSEDILCKLYTPEEVEQILASHEEIRRNKKDEAREKYRRELYCRSVEHELMNQDREMELEPDDLDVDYDLGAMDDDDDYEMLRAMREERDAYDDFIASMDMK